MPNGRKKPGQEGWEARTKHGWGLPCIATPPGQKAPAYRGLSVCPLICHSRTIPTWTQKPRQLVPEARGPPPHCC